MKGNVLRIGHTPQVCTYLHLAQGKVPPSDRGNAGKLLKSLMLADILGQKEMSSAGAWQVRVRGFLG